MSDDKIRSEFERWYWGAYGDAFECLSAEALERDGDGDYENEHARFSFVAWQASRQAIEIELPNPAVAGSNCIRDHAIRDCLESAGLKVKP